MREAAYSPYARGCLGSGLAVNGSSWPTSVSIYYQAGRKQKGAGRPCYPASPALLTMANGGRWSTQRKARTALPSTVKLNLDSSGRPTRTTLDFVSVDLDIITSTCILKKGYPTLVLPNRNRRYVQRKRVVH
jgi:hypothetical protein